MRERKETSAEAVIVLYYSILCSWVFFNAVSAAADVQQTTDATEEPPAEEPEVQKEPELTPEEEKGKF